MLNDGTVLIVDSDDKTRDIVLESAVKHGEIPISCSSCGEARSLPGATAFQGCFLQRQSSRLGICRSDKCREAYPVIVLSRFAEYMRICDYKIRGVRIFCGARPEGARQEVPEGWVSWFSLFSALLRCAAP
jgi:hypothetical protein